MRTLVMHREKPFGAIASHPGEDHADCVAPGFLCHTPEEHIYTWTLIVHLWVIINTYTIVRATPLEDHVPVPGGDESNARGDHIIITCLTHLHRGKLIETFGERCGE